MKFLVNFLLFTFLFPSLALAGSHDPNRVLTPSADSVTSVAQTGAKLEDVKSSCGCTVRYVAKGDEKIDWVRGYNRVTKTFFRDIGHNHTFAPGSILWMNPNGKIGVAEGCLNEFNFKDRVSITVATVRTERQEELQGPVEIQTSAPPPQVQIIREEHVYYPQQQTQAPAPVQEKKGFCSGNFCKGLVITGVVAGVVLGSVAVAKSGHRDQGITIVNQNTNTNSSRSSSRASTGQSQQGGYIQRTTPSRSTSSGQKLETINPYRGGMSNTPTYGYVPPQASPVTGITPAVWQNVGNISPNGPNIASQNTSRTGQPVRNVNPRY